MGSEWWLSTERGTAADLDEAEALVHSTERRFSRFLPDSLLSQLNATRQAEDRELADLMLCALEIRAITDGAFGPAVGDAVAAAGYTDSFDQFEDGRRQTRSAAANPPIAVRENEVRLGDGGTVDLGGIAKGWTADRVAELLRERDTGITIVDAGGDLLVQTGDERTELIGLGVDGYSVRLSAGAIATSSVLKRRWESDRGDMHHIIAPETRLPAEVTLELVSVVAPDAATADALATALIADPTRGLPALRHAGAAALVVDRSGDRLVTPELEALLA